MTLASPVGSAADVVLAEKFPGDAAVREVLEDGEGRVEPLVVEGFEVGLDVAVEEQLVTRWAGFSASLLSHERCGRAGARSSW